MTSVTLHVEELLSQIRNIPEDTQPETPLLFMATAGKQPIKIMHCVSFENTWVSKYPADCPEIFFFQSILKITFTSFAGLRLSSESNAFEVIQEVERIIEDASINSLWHDIDVVRILSGEGEGAFSWLAANYLNGYFNSTGNIFTYIPKVKCLGIRTQ